MYHLGVILGFFEAPVKPGYLRLRWTSVSEKCHFLQGLTVYRNAGANSIKMSSNKLRTWTLFGA